MKYYLITFRSVTFAQKAERALKRDGVDCMMQRTPKELSKRGCGYCLKLRGSLIAQAKQRLDTEGAEYGKIYGVRTDGGFEELEL